MSTPYVVVVDDEEVIRQNISKKLSRLHCHVRSFESGEAVVEFFANQGNEPDIILLDYKMGGMNGVETLKGVRKFSAVPAVIFTSYAGLISDTEIKGLGHCEVKIKTVDLNILGLIVDGARAVKTVRNRAEKNREA